MRSQQPHHHASRRDVAVPAGGDLPDWFPGRGLCCPDDPLDLVLQLFPSADRAPPPAASLDALGIGGGGAGGGGGGEPDRTVVKQEPESPKTQPLEESVDGLLDSWDLLSSALVLEGLWSGGPDETDVDMFFADDDTLDAGNGGGGGGEATQGNNLLCDTMMEVKPEPPARVTAGGPVHTPGSLGGGAGVTNDASPLPAPTPAGAFPLQAYDACRAFDGAVFSNASPAAAPVPAGGAPPVFVTSNSTPPLPALMAPAVPAGLRACGALPGIVSNGPPAPPPLPALIMPAGPAPMPLPAASLHACGIVSNIAPAPPPLMARMPARALHPNAAAWAGVYSSYNAPAAHGPPSATPSSSPPSRASSGSGRWPSSSPTPEPEFLQPHHVWVVPRKHRSPAPVNRRRRPWVLEFPLHALPPVVALLPPANPGGDDDEDAKNRYALVLFAPPPPPGNTGGDDIATAAGAGGGIRRRRPAPRQRNRQAQRQCSHCHSAETPQWRAGPDGPGTLCNACGIRYAADRLLPEYRPSTAPSFRSGQHSNRHRKVMKLREQQMKAAKEEEKPSPAKQQPMEDHHGRKMVKLEHDEAMEKDDNMGVCEYISAAGFL